MFDMFDWFSSCVRRSTSSGPSTGRSPCNVARASSARCPNSFPSLSYLDWRATKSFPGPPSPHSYIQVGMNAQIAKSICGPGEPLRHAPHFTLLLAASWQQYSVAPFLDTFDKLRQVFAGPVERNDGTADSPCLLASCYLHAHDLPTVVNQRPAGQRVNPLFARCRIGPPNQEYKARTRNEHFAVCALILMGPGGGTFQGDRGVGIIRPTV